MDQQPKITPESPDTNAGVLDYGAQSRWRLPFNKERFTDFLKNLLWVGPLTVLIWVYAEREQTLDRTVNDVQLSLVSIDKNRYVEFESATPPKLSLKLWGPQSTLDKVIEQLVTGVPRGIELPIDNSRPVLSDQRIPVMDYIQNLPIFKENGITVMDCSPKDVVVNIDTLGSREIPVEIPPSVTNLTSATAFTPAKVKVEGPDKVLNRLFDTGMLKAFAGIADSPLIRSPGKHDVSNVQVVLAARDERVTVDPTTVKASLDVRATDVPGLIRSMPLTIQSPLGLLRGYDVTLISGDQTVANIHVIGPQTQIERIDSQQFLPRAVLEVTGNDINHDDLQRELKFVLPDGVRVTPEDANRTVEFKLTRRSSPPG